MNRSEAARRIDHTLLRPEATGAEVRSLAAEARRWGCASACVQPVWVSAVAAELAGSDTVACSVVGFPHGTHTGAIKVAEAVEAVEAGAAEIDVVVNPGQVAEGDWSALAAELSELRRALDSSVLKVILETGLWDGPRLVELCSVALDAGADFLKTSTGFHPCGGASIEAVSTLAQAAAGRARVKASGGIRTPDDARRMFAAGADRLGASATESILAGFD